MKKKMKIQQIDHKVLVIDTKNDCWNIEIEFDMNTKEIAIKGLNFEFMELKSIIDEIHDLFLTQFSKKWTATQFSKKGENDAC